MENVTITSLIQKKEQLQNKTSKTAQLFVPSLEGNITVKTPDKALVMEALEVSGRDENIDANEYLLLECCIEPNLKDPKLLEAYKCATPLQLIGIIFDQGEVVSIADHLSEMAGLTTKVTLVDQIKN